MRRSSLRRLTMSVTATCIILKWKAYWLSISHELHNRGEYFVHGCFAFRIFGRFPSKSQHQANPLVEEVTGRDCVRNSTALVSVLAIWLLRQSVIAHDAHRNRRA